MRLDDINNYLDVKQAHDRLARRAGFYADRDILCPTISMLREAATLTDSPIKREPLHSGDGFIFKFTYRDVDFYHMGNYEEVE